MNVELVSLVLGLYGLGSGGATVHLLLGAEEGRGFSGSAVVCGR